MHVMWRNQRVYKKQLDVIELKGKCDALFYRY